MKKAKAKAKETRCSNCGLPVATQRDYDSIREGEGARLCWASYGTPCQPIDWRARAEQAERERDEACSALEALREAALDLVRRVGPWDAEAVGPLLAEVRRIDAAAARRIRALAAAAADAEEANRPPKRSAKP